MSNKSKYHQAVKVEKENENIKLRKKSKSLTTDKNWASKKETVWDRLSKINKGSSSERVSEVANSRPHFIAKTQQRFHSIDHTLLKQSKQPFKKSLNPNKDSVKKQLGISQKTFLKKPEIVPKEDNGILLSDLTFEDRSSSSDIKYSTDSSVDIFKFGEEHKESSCCSVQKNTEISEASIEEYTIAPLMASRSEERSQSNFNRFYPNNNKPMTFGDGDVEIPKNLKDILETQLENMLTQEFAVKKVLYKLESSDNLQTSKIIEFSDHKKEIQKFEVDVVFKNVPTLDKEIEILRALGEKLEATLRSTNINRNCQTSIAQNPANSTTKPPELLEEKSVLLILGVKDDFKTEHFALVSIQISGIRQCVGIINEFSVVQKSIVELKREPSHQFFIPTNCENIQLMATSFRNLKEAPNELFRHVKPKNSQIAFNLLEQDPMFFYSALSKLSKISHFSLKNHDQNNSHHQLPIEQGGYNKARDATNQEIAHKDRNFLIRENESKTIVSRHIKTKKFILNNSLCETQKNFEPIIRCGKRRFVTPLPIAKSHWPKNSLVKIILVGFVFILLIVALTHPCLRCLTHP